MKIKIYFERVPHLIEPKSERLLRSIDQRAHRSYRTAERKGVRQALTTEAISECMGSGSIWEAELNVKWLDLVSTPAAADWDVSFTVERINF